MALSPYAPRPVPRPLMLQSWERLAFLHWRYPFRSIAPRLPRGLSLDTFDGSAWVGLVPFRIAGLRPPWLPAVPWLSHFAETNVRTYVRGPDGEPGVWFFTLEAARLAAVVAARLTYGLPYRWAQMDVSAGGDRVEYTSRRIANPRPAFTRIAVRPGSPLDPGDLEIFLTARYRLYSSGLGCLAYADVDHPPWPLQNAELLSLEENLLAAVGLSPPVGQPLVHYSERLEVKVAPVRFCRQPGRSRARATMAIARRGSASTSFLRHE